MLEFTNFGGVQNPKTLVRCVLELGNLFVCHKPIEALVLEGWRVLICLFWPSELEVVLQVVSLVSFPLDFQLVCYSLLLYWPLLYIRVASPL